MFANGYAPYMMYIAWILCYSLGGGMAMVYFSKKQCDISYALYFRMVFLPCIVITAAMVQSGALSLFYFESSIYRSAITFFLTTLGLVLSMLMVMSDNEKKIIVSLLKELRNNT